MVIYGHTTHSGVSSIQKIKFDIYVNHFVYVYSSIHITIYFYNMDQIIWGYMYMQISTAILSFFKDMIL